MKIDRRNDLVASGLDKFGNPTDKAYDLGGVDDERLRGERIVFCVAYQQEDVLTCARTLVQPAVASRNIAMDVVGPAEFKGLLSGRLFQPSKLSKYSQIWYLSDRSAYLNSGDLTSIEEFSRAGNGVFIWADNEPYYADANALASRLAGTGFSGNRQADRVLEPGKRLQPGVFIEHPLTSGLNTLYEGITICSISPARRVTILGQSHDGQNCMACFEHDKQRVVLDTGFTKIAGADRFNRTAGTARYVRNVAFWLARGARDSNYSLLTTPERLATIQQGQWSEEFGYRLPETSSLVYLLVWQDSSELELEVKDPSGRLQSSKAHSSPVKVEIAAAQAGLWRCRIYGRRTGAGGCRYVLTVVQRNQAGKPTIVSRVFTLESHPVPKPGFSTDLGAGDRVVDLRKTAFQIRAGIERRTDGSLRLVVHPGAEIRVQAPNTKQWIVYGANSSIELANGSVFFDPDGKSSARITEKRAGSG